MSIEFNAAAAELEGLQEEVALLNGIRSFTGGRVKEGSWSNILAKAIKLGVALPLKYTHSLSSLRNLYVWAVECQDTEMIRWSTLQIIQVLGRPVLERISNDLKASRNAPNLEKSPRQQFHEVYNRLTEEKVSALLTRLDVESFWHKQLRRFVHANQACSKLLRKNLMSTDLNPLSETLRTSLILEYGPERITQDRSLTPRAIVEEAKVSPYVVVPCLFDAFGIGTRRNWKVILESEFLYKGWFRKGVRVEPEVVEMLLKMYDAPENVIEDFVKKWK
jgi:hypothetical protein